MTASAGSHAMAGWTATLDQLDWAADAAWVAIGRGDLEGTLHAIDVLNHPPVLPPLPEELGDRAAQILERLRGLEGLVAAALHEVSDELTVAKRRVAAPAPGPRAVPCFIDRRT